MRDSRPIFVFGSNLGGRHGRGAAKTAHDEYGAQYGIGEGRTGHAYALPTKDYHLVPRALHKIQESVTLFLEYAREHPGLTFQVTRVGCGLAGFKDHQIAPMFAEAPSNCQLPEEWKAYVIRQSTRV